MNYGKIAHRSGMDVVEVLPSPMLAKMPAEFLQLGFDTHGKFDDLADLAASTDDSQVVLAELGVIMQNCVGCHAAYRIDIEE